jgi:hypothetical protein
MDQEFRDMVQAIAQSTRATTDELLGLVNAGDRVGVSLNLKWIYEELKFVRNMPHLIGLGVFTIATATVVSVWHLW